MTATRVKIVGGHFDGRPLKGSGVRVLIEVNGEEILLPALSLTLKVGSVHEAVVATIEVPAHLVDLNGVELRTEAVVAPGGPDAQWADALGRRDGEPLASVETYAEPHRDAWRRPVDDNEVALRAQQLEVLRRTDGVDTVKMSKLDRPEPKEAIARRRAEVEADFQAEMIRLTDPLDDLDKVIAADGDVSVVLPKAALPKAAPREFRVLRGQSCLPQAERETWPAALPWAVVEPWRAQAERNHGQTLERLNERGGLSPEELWCVAHGKTSGSILRHEITESAAGQWLIGVAADAARPAGDSR